MAITVTKVEATTGDTPATSLALPPFAAVAAEDCIVVFITTDDPLNDLGVNLTAQVGGSPTGASQTVTAPPYTPSINMRYTTAALTPGSAVVLTVSNTNAARMIAVAYLLHPSSGSVIPNYDGVLLNQDNPGGATITVTAGDAYPGPQPLASVCFGALATIESSTTIAPGSGWTEDSDLTAGTALHLETEQQISDTPPVATWTNGGGASPSNVAAVLSFTAPVRTIVPPSGGTLGADPVTITISGFIVDGATVTFDGVAATAVVFVESGVLTGLTPAHAVGVVDVVITNPDTTSTTLTGGFSYGSTASAPTVDAGSQQNALGPLPSVVTTVPTIVRGQNNGTLTYAWTFLSGPGTPTIDSPTSLITTITFDAFAAGEYLFQLAVTTESDGVNDGITAVDTLSVVIDPDSVPVVTIVGVEN